MKIKNLKLMLLGIIGLMSASNVFAADPFSFLPKVDNKKTKDGVTYKIKEAASIVKDETGRSVNNIVYDLYTVTWTAVTGTATFTTKEAFVVGVNGSAADTEVATLAIPAKVTGDKGEYDVVEVASNWKSATGMKNVTALTTTLSVDITNFKTETEGTDPVKEKTGQTLEAKVYNAFTKLESLTITDSYEATATAPARYTIFQGGFDADAQKTLTTANLTGSNIDVIDASAFEDCVALTGFDFGTKIKAIGNYAFDGCYGISELTIPATVISIGTDAFANMYQAGTPAKGLKTLVINGADNTYNTDKSLKTSVIPAVFTGDALIESITIGSKTATEIKAGAFNAATGLKVIDLSGAEKLATIAATSFATGCELTSVKLYGSDLDNANFAKIDFSGANRTLATLTLPAKLSEFPAVTAPRLGFFHNFIALSELDLSVTKVTAVPNSLFHWTKNSTAGLDTRELDDKGKATGNYLTPVLATVKLNAETASIGANAFNKCVKLATVENLNNEKLTAIGAYAFNSTSLPAVDLSATKVTSIPEYAFGNIATMTSIKLPDTVEKIYPAAFANAEKVTSINLEDLQKLTVLNPIFHEGVVNTKYSTTVTLNGYDITDTKNEVAIPLTSLTLPEKLVVINPGALQLLDIEEIVIPATVREINQYALQGCIKLKKFVWDNAKSRTIQDNAFRGDDHLELVRMVTKTPGSTITIGKTGFSEDPAIDVIFKGNKKDVLKFIVNSEDLASLQAAGWSETNLHYCTLTDKEASIFEFNEKAKTGEFYYATYYNADQAAWFPEQDFEVFGAVVENSDVVLTPATVEEGYYKVSKAEPCVIRSKSLKAEIDLKNASFNNISTMPTDNDLKYGLAVTPSRINFTYKLGIKSGIVAFYRIVTGKINGVYIQANTPTDRLNLVINGEEATAIKGINAVEKKGAIYNLNGMRVNKAGKGIYIQDGKKYVIK